MPFILVLLLMLVACQPASSPLLITPGEQVVVAGGSPVAFTARFNGEPVVASWALTPQVGSLNLTTGSTVLYTPPTSLSSATTVLLVAQFQGFTSAITLRIEAFSDTEPPRVLSVSPPDLATGIAQGTPVVLTFSEPMNREATLAALQFNGVSVASASLSPSWNAAGTELTFVPSLSYATGNSLQTPAQAYLLTLSDTATDLAGNPLASFTSRFSSLRRLTLQLPQNSSLTGDITADGSVNLCAEEFTGQICVGRIFLNDEMREARGFYSFDISAWPAGVVEVEQAVLSVDQTRFQYGNTAFHKTILQPIDLPEVRLEHLIYTGLNRQTYYLTGERLLGVIREIDQPDTYTFDVAAALQQDYQSQRSRSQYRLSMPLSGVNIQLYTLFSREAVLEARLLLP